MKLIKKSLSILIALILVFTAMPVFAAETQTVNVVAAFDKNSVEAGKDVTLTFSFDQKVENVSSFTFYVEYDEDLFTYDKDKSHMPEGYNLVAGTVSYQEDTPKANTAKFGFMHISPEEAAFDGNDDYEDDFYYMVFTANSDIEETRYAEFKLNAPGTAMLTYILDGDDLGNIDNEVVLTVNGKAAGTYGNNVNIEITPKQSGASGPWDGETINTEWYDTTATEFDITTPAQLAGLAAIVNGTADGIAQDDFSGKTVNLKADLDLGGHNWTPIGRRTSRTEYVGFAGYFEGNSHIIDNLNISYDVKNQTNSDGTPFTFTGFVGLFGCLKGSDSNNRAIVKNLAIIGEITLTDSGSNSAVSPYGFAGIAGNAHNASLTNCISEIVLNNNSSTQNLQYIGGIVGYGENVKFYRCANLGSVNSGNTGQYTGGIVGTLKTSSDSVIEDCYNRGNISAPSKGLVGGLAGNLILNKNNVAKIHNFYSTGSVTGSAVGTTGSESTKALIGKTNATTNGMLFEIANVYYLDSINLEGGIDAATPKTDNEMKSAEFVDLLNDGRTGDNAVWAQSETYPIFIFQTEPSTPSVAVTSSGDAFVLGENYSVDGSVVTVTFEVPCKVGYLDESGNYVAIEAVPVEGEENTYSFTAPEGVTEVVIAVKGDSNLDGKVTNADSTKIKAFVKGTTDLSKLQQFAGDSNGDGKITNADSTKIKAYIKGTGNIDWDLP